MKVAGHDNVRALLTRLRAHSLLFVGPERVGKRQVARWYAAFLNCLDLKAAPCGSCASCLAMEAGWHPDYREIGPHATTSTGRQSRRPELRIDQLVPREKGEPEPLSRWLEQRPQYRRRVGVIDRADTLTSGAANAFLKFLEEPPSYATIVLIAPSREAVLPTVSSRAATVRFGTVTGTGIAGLAEGHPAERLGQIGQLIAAAQNPDAFRHALGLVDEYLGALRNGLDEALEAASALENAWLAEEDFDVPHLLRARLSELPPGQYAAGLLALSRTESALASYASPAFAIQELTLALRQIVGSRL